MVQLLLLFIRSTREGDWLLDLSTIRSLLPWFFAYSHIHYARYFPAYWLQKSDLPKTHPDVHQQLLNGEFTVQRQSRFGFSQVACDQTIEQTCNRDTKTKGRLTDRWILSSHERAEITRECENIARKFSKTRQKKDLDMRKAFKEEEHTLSVMQTVVSMMNPFEFGRTDLVHISSGVVTSDDVTKDVLGAYGEGDLSFQQFCTERLQQGNKDMIATMPENKVKSFATMAKQVKSKQKDREIVRRSDSNLFARLVLIGNSQHVDIREMIKYSLGPVPLSLATCKGTLAKTSKSKIMHFLEGVVGPSVHCVDIPAEAAWVIDGMALLQQLQNPPSTFGLVAKHVLRMLLNFNS
ncbi:hypothetical protein HOLleu_16882 [Holothuria leucospilota]|uniref:Uncharacterized protein n=1 Tax=Holothuria leucospilota TaxID=206669 RepID=A0A9Q1C6F5_HOLLE|nr:hypothetical protein HOLleu_16882 [Holothuria leucospilota]